APRRGLWSGHPLLRGSLERPTPARALARAQGVPDRPRRIRPRDLQLELPPSANRPERHRDAAAGGRELTLLGALEAGRADSKDLDCSCPTMYLAMVSSATSSSAWMRRRPQVEPRVEA